MVTAAQAAQYASAFGAERFELHQSPALDIARINSHPNRGFPGSSRRVSAFLCPPR